MSDSGSSYPPADGGQQPPSRGGDYPPYPQGGGAMGGDGRNDATGFFGALFDFSFNSFVTPKIVKLVYILATAALALGVLIFVVAGFAQGIGSGIVALIVVPLVGLVYLAFIRMTLEFYFALVRMSEDINERLPRR